MSTERWFQFMATPEANPSEPLVRNVSDTARWVAVYRAMESERPDALFHDAYARRLAGERGEQIAAAAPFHTKHAWTMISRTLLIDELVEQGVAGGCDMVINCAAGLDTRPYRMPLPATLRWVEVDLPGILDYKEEILKDAVPVCRLERFRCDLADGDARRELFARLGGEARRALVITEGLLIYLTPEDVTQFARDLAAQPVFHDWVFDLAAPGLLRMMTRQGVNEPNRQTAPFKFAPAEGTAYFEPFGWRTVSVQPLIKAAARYKRLPGSLRIAAWFPARHPGNGRRPWSGVCHLRRASGVS